MNHLRPPHQEDLPLHGGKVPTYSLYEAVSHDWSGVSDALQHQIIMPDPIIR